MTAAGSASVARVQEASVGSWPHPVRCAVRDRPLCQWKAPSSQWTRSACAIGIALRCDRHAYIALDQFLALLKKFSTRTYHAYPTTMCSSSDAYGFSYPDECPLREAQQSSWAHQHTVTVPRSAARNDLRDTPSGVLREPAVRRIHEALHQVGESGPVKVRFEFQNFRPNGKLDCRTSFSIRLCFYATWNRPVARISPTLP